MFKHILVPLDGSGLAEVALPTASAMAQELGSTITLIHILEKNASPEIHGDRHLTDKEEAFEYLKVTAQKAFPPEVKVNLHVHTAEVENIAQSLAEHVYELNPDLIIMCSHGKGGMRDWMVGNVAQQVIAPGGIPVLIVKPGPGNEPPGKFSRFLVALDGIPDHERGLEVANQLAGCCGAQIHLVHVVHTVETLTGGRAAAGRFLPVSTSIMLDYSEEAAREYLQNCAKPILRQGLEVSISVERGEPHSKILQTAEQLHSDLIILGTHGKAGMEAFWAGSVGPKITNQSKISVLLVPVGKSD